MSLIEVLVAFVVLGIALTALLSAMLSNTALNTDVSRRAEAIRVSEVVLEGYRQAGNYGALRTTRTDTVTSGNIPFTAVSTFCPPDAPLSMVCSSSAVYIRLEVKYGNKVLHKADTYYYYSRTCHTAATHTALLSVLARGQSRWNRRSLHNCDCSTTRRSAVSKRVNRRAVTGVKAGAKNAGFTLVELLVAMGLFLVVLTIAFNAFSSSNKLVEADTGRVMASQNVQSALDILSADVRQAGEDLSLDLGVSGLEFNSSGKTVTVRRGVTRVQRLPLCAVSGSIIQVSGPPPAATTPGAATGSCAYNAPTAGIDPTNIADWRAYFAAQGNQAQTALLFRPATTTQTLKVDPVIVTAMLAPMTSGSGASFIYRTSVSLGSTVPGDSTATNGSLLVLVDQRRYKVVGSDLLLAIGGQTDAQAQVVAYGVTDLSVNSNLVNPLATATSMTLTGPWARIKSVAVTMTSGSAGQGSNKPRSFTATVFPRNIEQAR
ncbi:prepilin-type N-terminal cleavage/methylation domain-containing protein [Deinococcus sp. Arct2-2]|uniref:type II secretion system protein n=1 Tax=Deinococcus sp. Arct2-2 TaxID=2568653 RepID=UPI0010A2ECBB|nr:type II secretion system protein [Deinococcus sp. Arct2-2]THF68958.1 prepilin-type N-terminal cleavage/methylation domain-containing protein [Deinococcus sp. Arct2-2]